MTTSRLTSPEVRLTRNASGGAKTALIALAVVAVLAIAVYAVSTAKSNAGALGYTVNETVATHVLTAPAVADKVTKQLAAMGPDTPKILSVTVTTGDRIAAFEPNAGQPPVGSQDAAAVVWIVRAEGSFISMRVPPGAKPITSTTGVFLIDDATGEFVGMGMP